MRRRLGWGIGIGTVALGGLAAFFVGQHKANTASADSGSGRAPAGASGSAATSAAAPAPAVTGPSPLDLAARAPAQDVRIAPAKDGRVGAWLVVGPLKARSYGNKNKPAGPQNLTAPPQGLGPADEAAMAPSKGSPWGGAASFGGEKAAPVWQIQASNEGPIDLAAALKTKDTDLLAYAAGTLHLEAPGRFLFLVGADDGARLTIDGKEVLARDEARPQRDDDDVASVDLAAGDHPLVLKLHQREGGWAFGLRVLDAATLDAPVGAYVRLPGTTAADAQKLAERMSWISVDRGLSGEDGYAPRVTVRFPQGAPRGVPLKVHARLVPASPPPAPGHDHAREPAPEVAPPPGPPLFDVDAGEVPMTAQGAADFVASLPAFPPADAAKIEDGHWAFAVDVAGRSVKHAFYPRRAAREAVARADKALGSPDARGLPAGSRDSVSYLRDRVARFVSRGEPDLEAVASDAKELDGLAAAIEQKKDPYAGRTGIMRRAYVSPADGQPSEFALYVPANYDPQKSYPLIVALHGMNGRPLSVLQWFLAWDDGGHDSEWEDRHVYAHLPRLDAIVVAPDAHGNAMYRDLGEDDVMRVVDWAQKTYSIDSQKVTITGPSMGGIGTAAIALRFPERFAAAAPLCGYHSYFVRRDTAGRPVRPWERLIAEERSNTSWAFNGMRVPMWIVHGTKDLPEANSKVLIDRYKELGYPLKHDHPDLGHNVWGWTYEGLKGARWLNIFKKNQHPPRVRFRTVRTRYAQNFWVHVDELSRSDAWGEVDAAVKKSKKEIEVTTKGLDALHFDRDAELLDPGPVVVTVDGAKLTFGASEPLVLSRENGAWVAGRKPREGLRKKGEITGPLRDVFHAPLTFVYGASDPAQARANEEVARAWARVRFGVRVNYPVISDTEFFARGEAVANDRALFLVGNAKSNRVVRELEPGFPIRVEGDAVVMGAQKLTGKQLGAAFIRPNPKRPDRYVVVVEGVDATGTWRSLSLPDLLPDFVVYDEQVAPSRGQVLLSAGLVRAGGFFQSDWSLPAQTDDPNAAALRPEAKSEHDATPYLP